MSSTFQGECSSEHYTSSASPADIDPCNEEDPGSLFTNWTGPRRRTEVQKSDEGDDDDR